MVASACAWWPRRPSRRPDTTCRDARQRQGRGAGERGGGAGRRGRRQVERPRPSRSRRAGAGRRAAARARRHRTGHGGSGRLLGGRRWHDPRGRRRNARPLRRLARHFGGAAARTQQAARPQARGHGTALKLRIRSGDARRSSSRSGATTTSGCRQPTLPRTASPAPRSIWRVGATRSGASRSAMCKVPIWLLQQYNPDQDFSDLQPGTQISLPKVEDVTGL